MAALINLVFFLIVSATVIGAVWLSKKYKERFAEFPWWKAGTVIAVEVVAWVTTNALWHWVTRHPWIAIIGIVIIVIVLAKKKKREEQIL